jgi:hypothetical protein
MQAATLENNDKRQFNPGYLVNALQMASHSMTPPSA